MRQDQFPWKHCQSLAYTYFTISIITAVQIVNNQCQLCTTPVEQLSKKFLLNSTAVSHCQKKKIREKILVFQSFRHVISHYKESVSKTNKIAFTC